MNLLVQRQDCCVLFFFFCFFLMTFNILLFETLIWILIRPLPVPLHLSAPAPYEEPLFVKLCSPAHRRAAALALLSAQSSMDESSSSLASRSRSVSPLRSRQHNALLIGLSTGMFDANNPKVIKKMVFLFLLVGIRWEARVSASHGFVALRFDIKQDKLAVLGSNLLKSNPINWEAEVLSRVCVHRANGHLKRTEAIFRITKFVPQWSSF